MHSFDIRRSNSVTELWKKFEYSPNIQAAEEGGTDETVAQAPSGHDGEAASNIDNAETTSAENYGSQTLLAAFEAEMAKLLETPEIPDTQLPQQSASPPVSSPGVHSEPSSSSGIPNPTIAFTQAIHNIVDGAEIVRDEVKSRIPDFERQLQNAQRALPEHVGTTLQTALTTLESHVRNLATALNNISVSTGQRTGTDSQTQPSPRAHTVDGLRTMASEIGQMGQTLFTAFEHEFGRLPTIGCNQTSSESIPNLTNANNQEQSSTAGAATSDAANPSIEVRDSSSNNPFENEKETLVSNNPGSSRPTTQCNEATGGRNTVSYRPYDNCNFPSTHRFNTSIIANRSNLAQSGGVTRELNATAYGSYDNTMRQPRHDIGLAPPGPPGRANRPMASNAYQHPPANFPFRHPSHHHHQPFYPHHFPRHFSQTIPPPHYVPPVHYAPHAPPMFYTPAIHAPPPAPPSCIPSSLNSTQRTHLTSTSSRQPHTGVSQGNADGEMSKRIMNHSSRDKYESQTGRDATKTLFVGNVGFGVSESMIRAVFASKGFLVNVHLPLDSRTRKHAGFGYLQFPSIEAAKAALDALQGTHIDGHAINLEFSDNPPISSLHTSCRDHQASSDVHSSQSLESNSNGLSSMDLLIEPSLKDQSKKGKERASSDPKKTMTRNEPSPSNAAGPEASNSGDLHSTSGISLLDQDNRESDFVTRYPSLLSKSTKSSHLDSTHDNLVDLSPELEMRRFPPVSQLEAHTLAKRDEMKATAASPNTNINANGDKDTHKGYPSFSGAPKSCTQEDHIDFLVDRDLTSFEHGHRGLRRSNTMMPVNPSARLTGPFDPLSPVESGGPSRSLRRSATQRQSLREPNFQTKVYPHHGGFRPNTSSKSGRQSDYSRSDSNRLRLPEAMQETQASPLSRHNKVLQSRVDERQRATDDCVATLLRLGYGGAADGGRSRITMYAEVAGGNVLEAIEMIEEERKAYEQRQPM